MSISYSIDTQKLFAGLAIDKLTLDRELVKLGHAIERDAKHMVRVDTGNLKAHIVTKHEGMCEVVISADTKPPPWKFSDQAGSDYAACIEELDPYMEPALERNIGNIGEIKVLRLPAYKAPTINLT